jgi:hypothetical protein
MSILSLESSSRAKCKDAMNKLEIIFFKLLLIITLNDKGIDAILRRFHVMGFRGFFKRAYICVIILFNYCRRFCRRLATK